MKLFFRQEDHKMAINIKIDDQELKKSVKKLCQFPNEIPKATSSALNRTLTFTKKRLNQEVRKIYSIKAGEIQKTLEVRKANTSNLSASIVSIGSRLTLGRFSSNIGSWKRGSPIKVKIKKTSKTLNSSPKAFVTNLTGNAHIVRREGKTSYPIRMFRTISVPQMISNSKVSDKLMREAGEQLQKRINHEVEYRLSRHIK